MMKKKGLLLLCAASGVCMISVICLLGTMGLYAEKRGTREWIPEYAEREEPAEPAASAALETETSEIQAAGEYGSPAAQTAGESGSPAAQTAEDSGSATAQAAGTPASVTEENRLTEEELQNIWNKMYTAYIIGKHEEQLIAQNWDAGEIAALFSDMNQYTAEYPFLDNTTFLTVHEAGRLILKEINRLYQEKFGSYFELNRICLDAWQEDNGRTICRWEGYISNVFQDADPNYRSYQFTIDAVSGKITELTEFHPYQKDADYYKSIRWTDEQTIQTARQLIETYQLAGEDTLDWSSIQVYNGQEGIEYLQDELNDPDIGTMLVTSVMFFQNGQKHFYLLMDYETGALHGYLWADHLN